MHDPDLQRLVSALDRAVEWAAGSQQPALHSDVEIARLRLQCLSRRLGGSVAASPYLAFVERLCARDARGPAALAAGA